MSTISASNPFLSLPGVKQATEKGTVAPATKLAVAAQEISDSPRSQGSIRASEVVSETRKQAFASDIKANQVLVDALKTLNVKPTPEGLARIAAAATQRPKEFTNLVSATTTAALTLGKSTGAMTEMDTAMTSFKANASIRATDTADLAYIMARIVMQSEQTERDQAMAAIQAALQAAKDTLKALELEKQQLDKDHGSKQSKMPPTPLDLAQGKPFHSKSGGKGTVDNTKKIESISKRMDAVRDTINALQKQLAKQDANKTGELDAVIFNLVERAMILARPIDPKTTTQPATNTFNTSN